MLCILKAPLLKDDSFTRILSLGLLPKSERRWIVKNLPPEAVDVAAIEIQRVWRGYRVRAHLRKFLRALRAEFFHELGSGADQEASEYRRRPASQDFSATGTRLSRVRLSGELSGLTGITSPTVSFHSFPAQDWLSDQQQAITGITSPLGSHSSVVSKDKSGPQQCTRLSIGRHSLPAFSPPRSQQLAAADSSVFVGHVVLPTSRGRSQSEQLTEASLSTLASGRKFGSKSIPSSQCIFDRSGSLSQGGHWFGRSPEGWREGRADVAPGIQHAEFRRLSGHGLEETVLGDDLHPPKRLKMTKKTAGRLALEASFDRYVQQALRQGKTSAEMMQFTEYCAYRIQTWWLLRHRRFLRARFVQRLAEMKKKVALEKAAALEARIQEGGHTPSPGRQKKKPGVPPTEKEAAIAIQRAWRRHIDIQVYRYYRDLINFKNRGDPAVMLRCINPNEAKLLEPASGASVRFRLAGDRFPPNIYYKIFTHRPIQDLCANSPKDYTRPEAKQLTVRHRHNKVATLPPQEDLAKEHWYKRFENNGWRLVSDRLIHHIMNDPVTWESSRKTYQFDHSKLKRKQDVEKQKKSRKIEWMKKMYKEGMLRARADDRETVQLIEGAAAGMIATVENQGPEALEDWEVDELLDWTTSLNFEEYFSTWKDLATSAPADRIAEKTMSIGTSHTDPYELTVSTAPSRFPSTGQSRHTPATLSSSIHIKT